MAAHVTIITLGVTDVAVSSLFYESLGFQKSSRVLEPDIGTGLFPALMPEVQRLAGRHHVLLRRCGGVGPVRA